MPDELLFSDRSRINGSSRSAKGKLSPSAIHDRKSCNEVRFWCFQASKGVPALSSFPVN